MINLKLLNRYTTLALNNFDNKKQNNFFILGNECEILEYLGNFYNSLSKLLGTSDTKVRISYC